MRIKRQARSASLNENLAGRMTAAYFCAGDVVSVDKAALKKIDAFKAMPKKAQEAVLDLVERAENGDIVLQVAHIELHFGRWSDAIPANITIGAGIGGGRIIDQVTLPGICGGAMEVVEDPINQTSLIPRNARRSYRDENGAIFSIKEVDVKELEKHRNDGYAQMVNGAKPYDPLKNPMTFGEFFHSVL